MTRRGRPEPVPQCLTALETRARRPLPAGLGGPSDTGGQPLEVRDEVPWLEPAEKHELLDRHVAPFATWFVGPEQVSRHLAAQCPGGPGDFGFVRTEANGEPALGMYLHGEPFCLQALTVDGSRFSHVVSFFDHRLFRTFGLPSGR